MGHIDRLPAAVVELHAVRTGVVNRVRLRQIVEVFCAAAEVLGGVGGIAESEFPAAVEAHCPALRTHWGNGKEKYKDVEISQHQIKVS